MSKRILLNFGGLPDDLKVSDVARAQEVAKSVARSLSKRGASLIVAGTKQTLASVAAREFLACVGEQGAEDRLTTYLPRVPFQTGKHGSQYEALGRALVLDDWPWQRRERMVRACDVMMMMAGRRGSGHVAALARTYKKPTVAIPHYDGFAREEYIRLVERFESSGDQESKRHFDLVGNISLSPDRLAEVAVDCALWLGDNRSIKRRVFVAMPFSEEYEVRRDVEDAITDAVRQSLQWEVCLARDVEVGSNKPLTQIIPELIREAGIVVVDLASNRPNVYYEAGISHALGLPTIFIAKEGERPHFDVASHERIVWKDLRDLRQKLGEWLKEAAVKA